MNRRLADLAEQIHNQSRLLEKDSEGFEHWSTPQGEFWTHPRNPLFFDLAEQSIAIYGASGIQVQQDDVVLDCGANAGTFTRTALAAGASKVVAFEIDPRNLSAYRRTFAVEISAGKVILVEAGVWHRPDSLEAYFYDNANLNSLVMEQRSEEGRKPIRVTVPLVSIDDTVRKLGLTRVDFIKMDVEGAELKALAGAKDTITRFKPRLAIATENQPEDIDTIPAWVLGLQLGYRAEIGDCRGIRRTVIRPEVVSFTTAAIPASAPPASPAR